MAKGYLGKPTKQWEIDFEQVKIFFEKKPHSFKDLPVNDKRRRLLEELNATMKTGERQCSYYIWNIWTQVLSWVLYERNYDALGGQNVTEVLQKMKKDIELKKIKLNYNVKDA
jgi:hypothetical protein